MSALYDQIKFEIEYLLKKKTIPKYVLKTEVLSRQINGMLSENETEEILKLIEDYPIQDSKISDGESSPCLSYNDGQCVLTFSPCDACFNKTKIE